MAKGNQRGKMKHNADTDVPIFLRKTYHMIDSCDSDIACWSDGGDSFLVKDSEKFASTVIPQFFKHNNFSSFVRQLNFYGFRKVKIDSIRLDSDLIESKYWRFRHAKFIKGRPELLIDIKRGGHQAVPSAAATNDGEEVNSLKSEVTSLTDKVNCMTSEIDKLTLLVQNMMKEKKTHGKRGDSKETGKTAKKEDVGKKRKISSSDSAASHARSVELSPAKEETARPCEVKSNSIAISQETKVVSSSTSDTESGSQAKASPAHRRPLHETGSITLPDVALATDEELLAGEETIPSDLSQSDMKREEITCSSDPKPCVSPLVWPVEADHFFLPSIQLNNTSDAIEPAFSKKETTEDPMEVEEENTSNAVRCMKKEEYRAAKNETPEISACTDEALQSFDPTLVKELRNCLTLMPEEMQQAFVERLVAAITDPDNTLKKYLESIAAMEVPAESVSMSEGLEDTQDGDDEENSKLVKDRKQENATVVSPGKNEHDVSLPLAAAALRSMLSNFGQPSSSVKKQQQRGCGKNKKSSRQPSVVPIEA